MSFSDLSSLYGSRPPAKSLRSTHSMGNYSSPAGVARLAQTGCSAAITDGNVELCSERSQVANNFHVFVENDRINRLVVWLFSFYF